MSLNATVLSQSFECIKPDAIEFAACFYTNLFVDYPQLQPLFANTNMTEQEKKLLSAIVLVIENLRQPDLLTNPLRGLGARHVKYGVLPEHYPMVGKTLLKTFSSYLKADWTLEVEQAWTDAYAAIASLMLEGAEYPQEILNL
jgi:hemoglobin-like flavoprotein